MCVLEGYKSGDVVQVLGRDPACSNPDAPGGPLNLLFLISTYGKRARGHFRGKRAVRREAVCEFCLLCLPSGKACLQKLLVRLELGKKVCLVFPAGRGPSEEGLLPCLCHEAEHEAAFSSVRLSCR